MARIFYSMAGEGRGHAARARTLVEHLRNEHELVLFAPDDAYEFLSRCYGPEQAVPHVQLLRIPGIRFHYTNGRLNLFRSIASGLKYAVSELPRLVSAFRRKIQADRPDLIISDFEPALPRAAVQERVPLLTVDHQHVLLAYQLRDLPLALQWNAWSMSWAVWLYYPRHTNIVTSSFYSPPLKQGWEFVRQVGPLIRPEVARLVPTEGDYLLSYLRANTPESIVDMLAALGRPIKVYGLGERPSRAQLTFRPIHETRFAADLAGCQAVICAAGNQLIGESLFLGKPVFAVPEARHHEQRINAHYLKAMGVGDWSTLEGLQQSQVREFLAEVPQYRTRLQQLQGRLDGTADALQAIQSLLAASTSKGAVTPVTGSY